MRHSEPRKRRKKDSSIMQHRFSAILFRFLFILIGKALGSSLFSCGLAAVGDFLYGEISSFPRRRKWCQLVEATAFRSLFASAARSGTCPPCEPSSEEEESSWTTVYTREGTLVFWEFATLTERKESTFLGVALLK